MRCDSVPYLRYFEGLVNGVSSMPNCLSDFRPCDAGFLRFFRVSILFGF